jgi:Asp-tRNA(Asn)/Glu-tRNA(Gln) amidotransferase C subunit
MALTRQEVKNIAKLANLELSQSEIEKFRSQLTEVIDFNVEKLAPCLTQKQALQNTTEKHNGFFKVKAILE